MSHFVFRPGGIPVLVSVPHKPSPWLCFLVVRVDELRQQATAELQFTRKFAAFDGERRLSLVYDADNLASATLDHANAPPPPHLVEQIARHNGRDLRLLSLAAVKPCTVRWARQLGDIDHTRDERFEPLADLARATTLHVLFDYAWLNPAKSAQFLSLVDASKQLVGFPVDKGLFTEADWAVFLPADASLEAPPTYRDASLKRSRQSRTSSPQAPAPKRLLLDAAVDPGSPTEKATTTTASPSPRLLPSSPPPTGCYDIYAAIEATIAKLLPEALNAVLPDMLTRLLAVPTQSPAKEAASPPPTYAPQPPPPHPSANTPPSPPPPHPLAPLHALLAAHLKTHADALAAEMTSETHAHVLYLRDVTDVEMQEQLEEQRVEFAVLREDALMEVHRLCDAKLEELRERADALVEVVGEEVEKVCFAAREKLEQRTGLIKGLLQAGRSRPGSPVEGARRARSVPPDAGW
ncbi:hypothetical protein P171DRAFT_485615 [Karstenula rhodostoma CBS 690.94]|uniref:Uncharacterized protein n=1 Tax=Karstenula rhodostoma CBS 690.94 TaxID=1392251 RepID=A0A9P4PHM2_9PLEO|nr:hypothetical protein P171DRAFT_485615 [Karstenula rhodostoma CBS 690.94]